MRIGAPHAGLKSGPIESGRVWSIDEIVDTDRYPIDTTQLRHFRQEFIQHGICRLPGFIRSAAVADIVGESDATVPGTYRQDVRGNAYLTAAPPTDASGSGQKVGGVVDPRAIESRSALCALPYDQFDPSRAAATLYGTAWREHPRRHRSAPASSLRSSSSRSVAVLTPSSDA